MMTDKMLVLLTGCVLLTLVVLILMPFDLIYQAIGPTDAFLQRHLPWMGVSVGKLGHVVAFCVLTVVACFFSMRFGVKVWVAVLTLLLISVVTELAQIFVPNRTTRYTDLLWNLAGTTIGYFCLRVYLLKAAKKSAVQS